MEDKYILVVDSMGFDRFYRDREDWQHEISSISCPLSVANSIPNREARRFWILLQAVQTAHGSLLLSLASLNLSQASHAHMRSDVPLYLAASNRSPMTSLASVLKNRGQNQVHKADDYRKQCTPCEHRMHPSPWQHSFPTLLLSTSHSPGSTTSRPI